MRVNFSDMPDYTRQQVLINAIVGLENYIVVNKFHDRAMHATDAAQKEQDELLEELQDLWGKEEHRRFMMAMTSKSIARILKMGEQDDN